MKKVMRKITLAMFLMVGTIAANAQVDNDSTASQNKPSLSELTAIVNGNGRLASPFVRNMTANTPVFGSRTSSYADMKSGNKIQDVCNQLLRKTRTQMERQKYILKW